MAPEQPKGDGASADKNKKKGAQELPPEVGLLPAAGIGAIREPACRQARQSQAPAKP